MSHATLRKMHQNLWWAVGYNVVAFLLAAGILYSVLLSPEIAAFALSGSTLIVAINAPMLKRTKLARHRALLRKPAGCTGSRKGSCAKNKGW
jgi:Cu2+-exporting ATPase